MSEADEKRETAALDDGEIQRVAENRTGIYYKIARRTTVVFYPGHRKFCCMRCVKNECQHTRRVERWIEDGNDTETLPATESQSSLAEALAK